jgi:hypothetical protein
MDGLDVVHIHWTQESPDAVLKLNLLHHGEVPFDGPLKSQSILFSFTSSIFSSLLCSKVNQNLTCEFLFKERVMRLIRENKTSPEEIAIVNMQVINKTLNFF